MAYSITITNSNGKKYRFYDAEVTTASFAYGTKMFKQSLPDDNGENAIVINLGKDKSISAAFKLVDTTNTAEDAAMGTHTSTIYTIAQKLTYIIDTIITPGIEDTYTIDLQTHTGSITGKIGIIEDWNFDFSNQNPNILMGSLRFSIGGGLTQ